MSKKVLASSYLLTVLAVVTLFPAVRRRLQLSRAKHPSLRGHARSSRRIARFIRFFEYDEDTFFVSDGAPEAVARERRAGLDQLRRQVRETSPTVLGINSSLLNDVSDVGFTCAYRVPFPYRNQVPRELRYGSIVDETRGVKVKDVDGNWRYDVSGSYGVNVFGYDFYKDCIAKGSAKVERLGPVLGPYHPLIRANVERLKSVSGLDEVSFHMSGTEAVMQAVRLARYHTRRTHLVRFCGAYHGWWDGVQPGVGNARKVDDVYTLADLSERSLRVLETRDDIACVLINPLQAFHPNADAPGDGALIASDRRVDFDRERYARWLAQIRHVCGRRKIVLIFDEVFTGFRLAYRGAQEYFGIQADMVTYGKTLGGGLPVGVLCGRRELMKRYRDDAPADISFARGTFNSHPYVMGAMNEFLERLDSPEMQQRYHDLDAVWNARVAELNRRLAGLALPVRVANMQTILTVLYEIPSRYNWMFQFYLRAEGLELSWVGSGRFIMSLDYSDDDFRAVMERFVRAAQRMHQDQWWWHSSRLTNTTIKRMMMRDMLTARLPWLRRLLLQPGRADPARHVREVGT
ncbi:MAG TPA: aminotransferase class III-fold pyridoxal phosphate-dependent enzyme [Candidatus Margulisiibacteriota bacterium]|nr:aminotransferase class III-fold pyridoxal phosphate-dependent enzyme [Candidatus Margulisiibacteriota bacterium]